jgi:hypothetical protein
MGQDGVGRHVIASRDRRAVSAGSAKGKRAAPPWQIPIGGDRLAGRRPIDEDSALT